MKSTACAGKGTRGQNPRSEIRKKSEKEQEGTEETEKDRIARFGWEIAGCLALDRGPSTAKESSYTVALQALFPLRFLCYLLFRSCSEARLSGPGFEESRAWRELSLSI